MVAHGVPYFSFQEFDTTLTDAAKEYLDAFGRYYRDSLLRERQYIIHLTPGSSDAERKQDADLGFKRAKVVAHYLDRNYGIGERNFRIRSRETVTTVCVGFIVKEGILSELQDVNGRCSKKKKDMSSRMLTSKSDAQTACRDRV